MIYPTGDVNVNSDSCPLLPRLFKVLVSRFTVFPPFALKKLTAGAFVLLLVGTIHSLLAFIQERIIYNLKYSYYFFLVLILIRTIFNFSLANLCSYLLWKIKTLSVVLRHPSEWQHHSKHQLNCASWIKWEILAFDISKRYKQEKGKASTYCKPLDVYTFYSQ